ncbi:MAG: hypothetical protein RIR55_870 [Bacteroidota bacterium]
MRNAILIAFFYALIAVGCNNVKNDPATKAPLYQLKVERFDSAFFSMDTLQTKIEIEKLLKAYPNFSQDFITRILLLKRVDDTEGIKLFYRTYLPIYKEVQKVNAIKIAMPALEDAFRRLQFYFPKYALTHKVVFFVGPLESYGNIITSDALAIGLQMHMGATSKWYYDDHIQTIYPSYLSRRYTPDYIAISSLQNIVSDIYLPSNKAQSLIAQMVEAGKIQYIINACFPNTADSIRLGYTNEHCLNLKNQEGKIWTYLLHEKLIYSTNPIDIDNFMQDAAFNNVLGESLPGNIGKYIGYEIVDAWMHQKAQKGISMEALLNTSADKIFEAAAYNP